MAKQVPKSPPFRRIKRELFRRRLVNFCQKCAEFLKGSIIPISGGEKRERFRLRSTHLFKDAPMF